MVTLLHAAGLLGGLDGFMLRLIGSAGPAWQTAPATPEALPAVALIGTQLYEHDLAPDWANMKVPVQLAPIQAPAPH